MLSRKLLVCESDNLQDGAQVRKNGFERKISLVMQKMQTLMIRLHRIGLIASAIDLVCNVTH